MIIEIMNLKHFKILNFISIGLSTGKNAEAVRMGRNHSETHAKNEGT